MFEVLQQKPSWTSGIEEYLHLLYWRVQYWDGWHRYHTFSARMTTSEMTRSSWILVRDCLKHFVNSRNEKLFISTSDPYSSQKRDKYLESCWPPKSTDQIIDSSGPQNKRKFLWQLHSIFLGQTVLNRRNIWNDLLFSLHPQVVLRYNK